MNKQREEICNRCRMLPSIHHLDYPCCDQPIAPIAEEEYQQLRVKPDDMITREGILQMAEIAIRPYCLEKMKAGGAFDLFISHVTNVIECARDI